LPVFASLTAKSKLWYCFLNIDTAKIVQSAVSKS
jgi:hypothetical protein